MTSLSKRPLADKKNSPSLRAGDCVGPGEPDVPRFTQASWVRHGLASPCGQGGGRVSVAVRKITVSNLSLGQPFIGYKALLISLRRMHCSPYLKVEKPRPREGNLVYGQDLNVNHVGHEFSEQPSQILC